MLHGSICIVKAVLLFTLTSCYAYSQNEECYYDPSGVDYSYFLKHTKFKAAKWDNERKEARILLNNGDEVFVGYAACYQLDMNAKYLIKKRLPEKLHSEFLISKLLWMGSNVLNEGDYYLLSKGLKDARFIEDLNQIQDKERVFIGIEGSDYQSFLVYVVHDHTDFYVEISWSK